ncbi:hypothetical protein OSB04_017415 [Centaurea solstitialis]|uniref:Uncharacterized protein n=1 Tax=Centaurea solstitialis TaxID=347529 RepID=A0AA38WIC0_9ASTR|nr:hypothetical protein OSB04_017415 [Centaurea solstitialis]
MIENLDWLSNLSHLQHFEMNKISLAKANHWVDVILSLRNLTYLSLHECDLSEVTHPHSSFSNSSLSSSIQFLYLTGNNLNSSIVFGADGSDSRDGVEEDRDGVVVEEEDDGEDEKEAGKIA